MSTSLKDLAYTHIRGRLLDGSIQPGARISSRAFAREIGVSFIPVREAITQLGAEGLVEQRPGIGTFAALCNREDLRELYELREALEVHAIGYAAQRIDAAALGHIAGCNAKMRVIASARRAESATAWKPEELRTWIGADHEMHLTVLRAAGNGRLGRAVEDLRVLTQIFGAQRVLRPLEDLERACEQHDALYDALARHDADVARTRMAEHIRFACRKAIESQDATPA
jgi:DNA-binding GntR family transcriptional regulator